ncbi:MAG: glycosyltransferase family 39 protein [bacterium]|nr:glycosyltransferase family 39 protein [bacterium]
MGVCLYPDMIHSKTNILIIIAIVIVFIAVSWLTIDTKQPWHDEAWFACPAYNLVYHGNMGTTIKETAGSQWTRIDKHTYWLPPLHFLAQALWYKIFGFSLFSMRFLSVFFGLIALVSIFSMVTSLSGNRSAGILAMGLTSVDFIFINSAADGRMDMMCTALAFASFASYLSLRKKNLSLAILTGHTLVVLSGLTHPNGILALFGMVFLNLYLDRKEIRIKHILLASIPYILGATGWGIYILQDPQAFRDQFGSNIGGRVHESFLILSQFVREFSDRYLFEYGIGAPGSGIAKLKIFILVVYIVGVVGSFLVARRSKSAGIQTLLWLFLVFFFTFAIFFNNKQPRYLVYILPLYASILAAWIISIWGNAGKMKVGIVAMLVILIALQLGVNLRRIQVDDFHRIYMPVIDVLRENIDDSTLVMGMPEIAFEFGFTPNIIDDYTYGYFSGKVPDIIILDDQYRLLHSIIKEHEPEIYDDIQRRINDDFVEIYSNEQVSVYRRIE